MCLCVVCFARKQLEAEVAKVFFPLIGFLFLHFLSFPGEKKFDHLLFSHTLLDK